MNMLLTVLSLGSNGLGYVEAAGVKVVGDAASAVIDVLGVGCASKAT